MSKESNACVSFIGCLHLPVEIGNLLFQAQLSLWMIPDGDVVCFSLLDLVTKGHLWIIVTEQGRKNSTFTLGSTSKQKME